VQYERYIDAQLRKTRLQVKGVELTTALITLAVGSLAYLFLVALIDHWVVKGGLGFAGRLVFLLAFLAGAGAYFGLVLWPLLVRRINPVYAAQAIERSRPSLKNSLINFLLLRTRPGGMSPMVYEAIERQAADGLSQVSVESAVDRSRMLKVGWALLAIVSLCAIYTVVSPKNPLRSFGRVVAPWADIAAPTRVRIADVTPGNERAFHDQFVTVSAEVSGVADGEPVTLFYSTADGQLVDQAVSMTLPPGGLRYTAELPPTSGGLQQDLEYYLVAGDAVTKRYGIHVLITPSILVRSVDYQFPQYTEIDTRIADRQGDLKGIEGTRVTIHAEANDDIKSAYVDFDCDGRSDVAMQVEGRKATATFALGLKPKSNEPEHASYQLRFQNHDGEENPRPIRHQIEVIKDLAPQIVFVEPIEAATQPVRADVANADRAADKNLGNKGVALKRGNKNPAGTNQADRNPPANPVALDPGARAAAEPAEQQLPQGGFLRMAVEASDPDFKLGSVKLMAQRNGQPLLSKELLAAPSAGPFHGAFFFNANDLKLVAGDTVVYWAVAEDNKQPDPSKAETQRFKLRITSPEQQQPKQDQVANADSKQQPPKPNDRNPNPKNQDPKNQPQGNQPKQENGQKGESKPSEGGGQGKSGAQQQREKQRNDQQRQDEQPSEGQQGEGKAGEQKSGEQNPDPKNQDEKNSEQKNTENQSGDSNDGGEASAGEGKPGKGKSGDEKSSGGKAGEKKAGQSSEQDKSSGQEERPVDPDAQPGDAFQKILNRANQEQQKDGGEKSANQSTGDPMKGDQNPGQKPGEQGDDPSTDKKPDDKKPDDKQPPEQKPDEQPQGGDAKGNESTGGKSKGSDAKGGEKPSPSGDKPAGSKPDSESGSAAGDTTGEPKPDGSPSEDKSGNGAAGKSEQPKGAQLGEKSAGDKAAGDKATDDKKMPGEKPQGSDASGSPSAEKGEAKGAEKGTDKGAGKAGDKPDGDKSATDDASAQPDMPMPGEPKTGEQKAGEPKAGEAKAGEPKSGDPQAGEPKAGDSKSGDPKAGQPKPGDGGKSGAEQPTEKQQKPPQAGAKSGDEKGGDAEAKSKGPAGAGEKGGNPKGSPSSQEEGAAPREKKQQPSGAGKPNSEDKPESPGISKKESDSKGGEDGDREGGGGKGGGQRSNSQGTGSAGKNTESNEGGGVANTPGKGETGEKGGDQAKGKSADGAGKSTGKSGDGNKTQPGGEKPGAGDDGKPGDAKPSEKGTPGEKKSPGENPGEGQKPPQTPNDGSPKTGEQPPGEPGKPGDRPPTPSKAGDSKTGNNEAGNKDPGGAAGNPNGGGGLPPEGVTPPGGKAAPNEEGEDPNLAYSRKATDLALEYLKDQMNKENPDKKLLEDLKWSREDAARFVAKWEKMKRDAQAAGPQGEAARKQLDGALDGLGLRPRGASLRGGQTSETRTPTVRDARRSEPPPEYRQQFRAFTKGVAKGEEGNKPASK